MEKILVADWLTKLSGKRTFEKIWLPLLRSKLGDSYRETSAAFIWATIQRMYAARKTGLKKEMFGYVPGGYARILKRFAEVLKEKSVEIRLNARVEKIVKEDNDRITVLHNLELVAESESFDRVILTVPGNVAARICPQLQPKEKQKLEAVRYQGIVCASVLLKKPLANFYVTNITDIAPFTAVIEMTALVDKTEFAGNALVYLPKYVAPDDPLFEQTDQQIKEKFLAVLDQMYPNFDRSDVLAFQVSRVRQVFALSTLNYSETLPQMQTSLENVFVINSAHIVNGTLNVNDTAKLAERAVAKFFC